jgi:hypothetical protein
MNEFVHENVDEKEVKCPCIFTGKSCEEACYEIDPYRCQFYLSLESRFFS